MLVQKRFQPIVRCVERVVRTFVATKAPLACSSNGCCAYTTCVVHTVHCVRPGHEKLNGVTLRILSWLAGSMQCSASVRAQVKTQNAAFDFHTTLLNQAHIA